MATFNPQFFTNPVASLNTAFGIPTCMLDLAVGALNLIDSGALNGMAKAAAEGQAAARAAIAGVVNGLFADMGILDYDADTGKLALFSDSSKFGIDLGFLDAAASAAGAISAVQDLIDQGEALYNEVLGCLQDYENWLNSTGPAPMTGTGGVGGGHSDQYTENARVAALGLARQQVEEATEFSNKCNTLIQNIGVILYERQQALSVEAEEEEPIFRLVFGPPVSKNGLFILSEDGMYYDSQERLYNGKPIPSASDVGFVLDSEKWKMDHFPNLGGKGTLVSTDVLNKYVDTIFDLNIIDDSANLDDYYKADHLVNVLLGQKTKQVELITGEITELLNGGYTEESALIVNHRLNLNSITDAYDTKIKKRKKQIEVAVKAPDLFGAEQAYAVGDVPVNDFSFLSSISLSVALDKQQNLTFGAGDVEGVVLPIKPLFVTNYGVTSRVVIDPIVVPPIGKGSVVFSPSVSSTVAPAMSLTDSIESSGLFAIYNFLKPDVVPPDSDQYKVVNCAVLGTQGNSQLVGDVTTAFASGVGIPYLGGVARWKINNFKLTRAANYLRLPPTTEMQNLFYNPSGCSIDCWLHIPNYGASATSNEIGSTAFRPWTGGAWGDYNYYKILLGNENMGGELPIANVSGLYDSGGSETTKGLLIGFSRDPVIYEDSFMIPGSNLDPGANNGVHVSATTASSCFFIAPTMSINSSSVEFVPDSECANDNLTYNKLTIRDNLSVGGKKFTDVSGGFSHLHMSFDINKNECVVYLDGVMMTTSALSKVLGNNPGQPPRLPTFISPRDSDSSSFYYSSDTVNQIVGGTVFNNGPLNDTYFTPWIVGGGWTDGYPIDSNKVGGFMGVRHGLTSGLNGFVGSLKFYSRPLTNKEVLQNYNAQKGFYKNIAT